MSRAKINQMLEQKKKNVKKSRSKGDNFSFVEGGPTIGDLKDFLRNSLIERGFDKIKNIQYSHKNCEFVVTFDLNEGEKNDSMGHGPYGMAKARYEINTILSEYGKR